MDIFSFTSFKELFQAKLQSPGLGNAPERLDRIANKLGYRSPSLISMVKSGKRLPSNELLHALAEEWKLSSKEREFLFLLVQIERNRARKKDASALAQKIAKIGQSQSSRFLQTDEFSEISEWHCLVILQLASLPGFKEDPQWISQALRKKVSPRKAEKALELLEQKGLLLRSGNKLTPAHDLTRTTDDIPSTAIRSHHRGMLERAAEALEEQAVDRRHFNSLTFKGDPADIPEIKEKIGAFARTLFEEYNRENGTSVFQMNLQFFEHTKTDYRTLVPESQNEH